MLKYFFQLHHPWCIGGKLFLSDHCSLKFEYSMDIFCLNHSTQHRSILFSPCWGFSIENYFLDSFFPPSFCDAYCLEQDFNMVKMKIFFSVPTFFYPTLRSIKLFGVVHLGKRGSPGGASSKRTLPPPLLPPSFSPHPSPPLPSFLLLPLPYLVRWCFHQCYVYCDSQSMVCRDLMRMLLSRVRI